MGKYTKRLRQARETWKEAAESTGFAELDDGLYMAKLVDCEIDETPDGDLRAVFTFEITDGEDAGTQVKSFFNLEKEVPARILQQQLAKLGVDVPDDPEELEEIFEELAGESPAVRLKLKTRKTNQGEFQDRRIERKLDADDAADEEGVFDEEPEDDDSEPEEDEDAEEEVEDEDVEEGEPEDEGPEFSEGDLVEWKTGSGTVLDHDPATGKYTIEKPDGKKVRVAGDHLSAATMEDDEVEEDDDGEDLAKGQWVDVDGKGEGKIAKLDEDAGLVHVKLNKTGKTVKVGPEAVTIIDEPSEPPKRGGAARKTGKKATRKAGKK